jgi:chitin disaccharide deacetylase
VKSLIVNADDLGWTEGVNRGIAEAHRGGLVTSASLLANGRAFVSARDLARSNPELGVGVHLNLSNGTPTASPEDIGGLLNANGLLHYTTDSLFLRIVTRRLDLDEVQREWEAQIRKIRAAGIIPTHLDGHKHVHMLPGLFEIAVRLAKKHGIRAIRVSHEDSKLRALLSSGAQQNTTMLLKQAGQARALKLLARNARELADHAGLVTTDYFCGIAQTGSLTGEGLESLLKNLPDGTTEFMCHPGYADSDLQASATRLQQSRQAELHILTDERVRKLVATEGIRLISYLAGEMA